MAKNYNRSDYALNKYSASIVYSGADGVYELTKEAFLASDPSLTEADYEYWKRLSDDYYLATARRDTYESRHICDFPIIIYQMGKSLVFIFIGN